MKSVATTVRPFVVGLGGTTKARSSPEKALKHALALALRLIVHALRGWPTPMGVAINTLNKTFDEQGAVIEETAARQLGILVHQLVDFARLRCAQAQEIA